LVSIRRSDDLKVVLTVKFTSVIETGDYANIQVFNLLLRNCLRHLDLKLIGRNFYDANAKVLMLFVLKYKIILTLTIFILD
jgi:aubergine-like protein